MRAPRVVERRTRRTPARRWPGAPSSLCIRPGIPAAAIRCSPRRRGLSQPRRAGDQPRGRRFPRRHGRLGGAQSLCRGDRRILRPTRGFTRACLCSRSSTPPFCAASGSGCMAISRRSCLKARGSRRFPPRSPPSAASISSIAIISSACPSPRGCAGNTTAPSCSTAMIFRRANMRCATRPAGACRRWRNSRICCKSNSPRCAAPTSSRISTTRRPRSSRRCCGNAP